MRFWCRHEWVVIHPAGYQDNVRVIWCRKCHQMADHGVRGEANQLIPFGFDAVTLKPLFGEIEVRGGKPRPEERDEHTS